MAEIAGSLAQLDLHALMSRLAQSRPIFHNEADLQHAFAWQVHVSYPTAAVRLETRPLAQVRWFLDVALVVEGHRIAVELKYLTRKLEIMVGDETYSLKDHSAHDTRRYDVVKDVARVEQIVVAGAADVGFAVVLSNDPAYWQEWTAADVADAAFRIHHGRLLSGEVAWSSAAGAGTTASRTEPLRIRGSYALEWTDYSKVSSGAAGSLRYMAVAVVPSTVSDVDVG